MPSPQITLPSPSPLPPTPLPPGFPHPSMAPASCLEAQATWAAQASCSPHSPPGAPRHWCLRRTSGFSHRGN